MDIHHLLHFALKHEDDCWLCLSTVIQSHNQDYWNSVATTREHISCMYSALCMHTRLTSLPRVCLPQRLLSFTHNPSDASVQPRIHTRVHPFISQCAIRSWVRTINDSQTDRWSIRRLIDRSNGWWFNCLIEGMVDWLNDWLSDWLFDCLIDWLCDWLSNWMFDCLIVWLFDCLIVWLLDCLIVWLFDCLIIWLFDCLIVWLFDWLIVSCGWSIDWMVELLVNWRIDWRFIK